MFMRMVTWNLKSGERSNFAQAIDDEVVPMLRKFNGFKDQITIASTDGRQMVGLSFWQQRSDAENYNRTGYQDVLKVLSKFAEGTPNLREFDVTNSTAHDIKARKGGA